MTTVGAYEAKTHLPELLKRVENGEHITIARHGTPVAVLVPVGDYPRGTLRRRRRRSWSSRAVAAAETSTIRAAIEEGRR